MSQQQLQQRLDQDFQFAPSERPKRRRPIAAAKTATIAALALTASLILLGLAHVHSYARLAQVECRRQALTAEARDLEAANAQLRFELERTRAQQRVFACAQQWGMALADPSCEVDYILLPPAAGAGAQGPAGCIHPGALLRNLALAQQVTSVVTTGWSGAAPGASAGVRLARP